MGDNNFPYDGKSFSSLFLAGAVSDGVFLTKDQCNFLVKFMQEFRSFQLENDGAFRKRREPGSQPKFDHETIDLYCCLLEADMKVEAAVSKTMQDFRVSRATVFEAKKTRTPDIEAFVNTLPQNVRTEGLRHIRNAQLDNVFKAVSRKLAFLSMLVDQQAADALMEKSKLVQR